MNLKLQLENIDEVQAKALAQLIKRIGWSDIRLNAADDGEAFQMTTAVTKLQDALARQGYTPQ
ncbi:hypothetical protein [Acinetobacter sp. Ac_5812]|uniref:DUF7706 family protein n=1 Tax=Acinetobacter sp. Ac_5812 TaxID=1848937 RepID=UPI00148F56F6|nr:hypothetical protein [Acinetobacter sp. Ac_5812]NNP68929.1 hypothetical protein [Acinetobacter sp. Ac_5812]